MAAGRYDFVIKAGSTFRRTIQLYDSSNNVIPISGYTAKLHIRLNHDADTAITEMTTENGKITITGDDELVLLLTDEQTAALAAWTGRAVYDLFITDGSGEATDVLEGFVTYVPRVST